MTGIIARAEQAINDYDSALLDNLDFDDAVEMIIGRLAKEKQRAKAAEAERDEARRQLEQAREASFELGRTLQFTRIGWDDTVTCESVLEPINKIAFKIGEALGIDDLH